ncbi:Interleukin-1 receptor antagonist protein, partial [Varanus komodoensis]
HSESHIESLEEPWLYSIWDVNQKFLFCQNNILVAAPRNSNSQEELIAVTPNRNIKQKDEHTYPIFIGINGGKQVLSCLESGGQPKLQLVEKDIMTLYYNNEEHKNFTFFSKTGQTQEACSIESIAFPGWFLSTSPEPDKPVAFSHEGGTMITLFYFDKKK